MRAFLATLLLVLAGCGGCATVPEVPTDDELRGLSLRLISRQEGGKGQLCGGTPMGPDNFVTARHCVFGFDLATVNGIKVKAIAFTEENADRVRVTLSEPIFKTWAKPGTVKQGDRVRWWGNPRGLAGIYRVGTVVFAADGLVVTDAHVCHGDSGSGLFNDAGEIVAVMSRMGPDIGPCVFAVAEAAK